MSTIHEHVLHGCRPTPLASYLKALGVLKLVAEQADERVRGAWRNDAFVLSTSLDEAALEAFFLDHYAPTPIASPWNGGSGFYGGGKRDVLDRIVHSESPRLSIFREVITSIDNILQRSEITEKVSGERKMDLLQECRALLPDAAVEWLDAAYFLGSDDHVFPPLLGKGGCDGNFEFGNNYAQRLLELIEPKSGGQTACSESLLRNALFEEPTDRLVEAASGMFFPGRAGGPNAYAGFKAKFAVNPWEHVLLLEGSLLFAASAARRMAEHRGGISYPFTVSARATGFASAAPGEKSNGEMWMPLWSRAASLPEIRSLLSEGRVEVDGRSARDALDFARAVAWLGVDRGLESFQRFGFQQRFGDAHFAAPLSRFAVERREATTRLSEISDWLERFRRAARGDRAPGWVQRAAQRLEEAIVAVCHRGDRVRLMELVIALGEAERALARSLRWSTEQRLSPVPPLSAAWIQDVDDGSAELRLAAALASVSGGSSIRCQIEPVHVVLSENGRRVGWSEDAGRDVVWSSGSPIESMSRVTLRRLVLGEREGRASYADRSAVRAEIGDVADFIEGRVDDAKLEELLFACLLIDLEREPLLISARPIREPVPGALYGLMKLCFAERPVRGIEVPAVPRVVRLASSGLGAEASRIAAARLRASGLAPAVDVVHQSGERARRAAAALLFPIGSSDLEVIAAQVLRPAAAEMGR